VSLAALSQPRVVGTIEGVGGRLAIGDNGILYGSAYSPFGGNSPVGGIRTATLGPILLVLDKGKKILPRIRLPQNSDLFVRAIVPGAGETINVDVSIVKQDGRPRPATPNGIPTETTLTLIRDSETGYYDAPLRVVDKDCALKLNESGDEATTPCAADLESAPWTRLDVKLPAANLERTSDIQGFRIATLGDSITHGVQEGIVVHEDQVDSYPAQLARQVAKLLGAKGKGYNQQQTIFTQALIADPGSPPIPPLGKVYDADGDGGRLNPQVHPVNNLGLSGAQTADIYTAKVGNYPLVDDDGSLVCYQDGSYCNPKASRHVWPLVLGRQAGTVGATPIPDDGTAVEAAGKLDPTLLIVYAGGNDVLGAARNANLDAITKPAVFRTNFETLIAKILATGTRADIVLATVPDVDTVPHMIPVSGKVGDLPFTVPLSFFKRLAGALLGVSEETATHALETSVLDSNDPDGGVYPSGTLTSLSVLAKEEVIDRAEKRHFLPTKFHLKSQGEKKDVLTPDQLDRIQQAVSEFNQIIRDIAQKHGFAVAEINALLHDRVTNTTSPTRLNGLRTGTLREQAGDDGIQRGIGNSLFCWDGIHPNGAGYSLMANEFMKAINARLAQDDFGGLSKGDRIPLITGASAGGSNDQITPLLMKYLTLKRTRIQREVTGVE
jgi:lysophospholipase L1-like esterase